MTDSSPEPAPQGPPPSAAETPDASGEQGGGASPYRNLWVPLVVVPFLVVGVLVLVFVFFGAIRGRDASMAENLDRVVHGGHNERKQAALSLVVQAVENREAVESGHAAPWETDELFLAQLQQAWEETGSDDNPYIRLSLARVLAQYGDPDVRVKLESFLAIPDDDDSGGAIRFQALDGLAALGAPDSAPAVIPFLDHEDPYLHLAAASALQAMPGEATLEALRGALGSPSFELRGMAAVSLSHLGDPAGADVLRDLVDPAVYEAIRKETPKKYADARLIQHNRVLGVQGLGRLGLPEDRALLERVAASDDDLTVREAAMLALRDRDSKSAGD